MRLPRYGVWAAGIALLPAGGALAAGGMPQLNPNDLVPQLVWLVILFVTLYAALSKVAMPRIASTLEARDAKIAGDLAAAQKASEDARLLVETYRQKLVAAREHARGLQRERADADSVAAAARLAELGEKLNARIAEAERRIGEQRNAVMLSLQQMAEEIGQSAYAKVTGQPADAGALGPKVAEAVKGSSR